LRTETQKPGDVAFQTKIERMEIDERVAFRKENDDLTKLLLTTDADRAKFDLTGDFPPAATPQDEMMQSILFLLAQERLSRAQDAPLPKFPDDPEITSLRRQREQTDAAIFRMEDDIIEQETLLPPVEGKDLGVVAQSAVNQLEALRTRRRDIQTEIEIKEDAFKRARQFINRNFTLEEVVKQAKEDGLNEKAINELVKQFERFGGK